MTTTGIHNKINQIVDDVSLSKDEKITALTQIYLDARALQRAANEGGMTSPGSPESAEGVSHAEDALRRLGVDPLEHEHSAADL